MRRPIGMVGARDRRRGRRAPRLSDQGADGGTGRTNPSAEPPRGGVKGRPGFAALVISHTHMAQVAGRRVRVVQNPPTAQPVPTAQVTRSCGGGRKTMSRKERRNKERDNRHHNTSLKLRTSAADEKGQPEDEKRKQKTQSAQKELLAGGATMRTGSMTADQRTHLPGIHRTVRKPQPYATRSAPLVRPLALRGVTHPEVRANRGHPLIRNGLS